MFKKLSLAVALSLMSQMVAAHSLTIQLENVVPNTGDIRVAIFDDEKQFPNGEFAYSATVAADTSLMTITVDGLPTGDFAISLFQDLNQNTELDTGFFGIPKEPYGFSGDWKKGEATFEEAVITIDGETEIHINMYD